MFATGIMPGVLVWIYLVRTSKIYFVRTTDGLLVIWSPIKQASKQAALNE